MKTIPNRWSTLILGTLVIAACSESSVSPTSTVRQPTLETVRAGGAHLLASTAVGSSASWAFTAQVFDSWGDTPAQIDDVVTGTMTFTITSGDAEADPCLGARSVESTVTYTLRGVPYTVGGAGRAMSYTSCLADVLSPYLELSAIQGNTTAQLTLFNTLNSDDFPLTPPSTDMPPKRFDAWDDVGGLGFSATLLDIGLAPVGPKNPQAKSDCMKSGWTSFGFKNQGQCVRFIETGKNSR